MSIHTLSGSLSASSRPARPERAGRLRAVLARARFDVAPAIAAFPLAAYAAAGRCPV